MSQEVKSSHLLLLGTARRVFIVLLLSASWGRAAEPIRVTDIVFDKLERLNKSQLLLTVGLAVGNSYSEEDLRAQLEKDIERLYRTGEFELVGPLNACRLEDFAGGKRVIIPVKEKKRIAVVYIRGGKPVGKGHLAEKLKTAAGRLFSPSNLREDRETVLKRCRAKGFYFAEVSTRVDQLPGGNVNVTFDVFPGPRVRVYEIEFVGNKSAASGELKSLMKTKQRDFILFGLWRKGYFSDRRLSEDMKQLRKYLRSAKGLLDATVGVEDISFDDRREKMKIRIRIEEGKPYTLKGFDIRTRSAPGRKPRFSVSEVLEKTEAAELIGGRYRTTELEKIQNRIMDMYREVGYLNCRVRIEEPRVELEGTEATAVLEIVEREPVYARRINIRGNTKTKDEVIRRELAFKPGELVTLRKIHKSMSNLYRLQYFQPDRLDIRPVESTASPEGTDFQVDVEEGARGQLLFGMGVTNDLGIIGSFILRKNNFDIMDWPESFWDIPDAFTGAGQTLGIELAPGTRYSRYRAFFHEPYLLGHWYGLTLSGGRDISGRDEWLEKEWKFALRLSRYFSQERDISIYGGYRYNVMEMTDIEPDAPQDAWDSKGTTRVSALSTGFNLDKTLFDPYSGPYRGIRFWIDYEYGGGFLDADVDFSKARGGSSLFIPLIENRETGHHVLMATANIGWMEPHSNTDKIPIFERFWLGGPYNVRGFEPYGLGPHENGNEIGGTGMVYGTVEYSWPFFFVVPQLKLLRGVAFFDWGQLEPTFGDMKFSRMRTVVGTGIRISLTPLGMPVPISLYWAQTIHDEPEDQTQQFTFSIGHIGF